jgi:predicted NBD/HSP70 family sugar kinase
MARVTAPTPGELLRLIRSGTARTRKALVEHTGSSRSTVRQRVDALIAAGLVRDRGLTVATGGRPATELEFDESSRAVLVAHLGATHGRLALTDLAARSIAERELDLPIEAGPVPVLDRVRAEFDKLLRDTDQDLREICGIGVSVPAPVDPEKGRVVQPLLMPGWNDYPVADHLGDGFNVPVVVDNDANLMAVGEHVTSWPGVDSLVLVKVGTGIGVGIVVRGEVLRGIDGAAGGIGHVRLAKFPDVRCPCGGNGCLAAVASGRALARRLRELGHEDAITSRDVVRLVQASDADAVALTREAGQLLGEVLATVVSLLNPEVLLLAGDMAATHENFLAGVREVVYQRSLPLTTRSLHLGTARLGDRAGIVGGATLVVDRAFAPDAVNAMLAADTHQLPNGQSASPLTVK